MSASNGTVEEIYDWGDWKIFRDGKATHKGRPVDWYKNEKTGKPWIPMKRRSFVSLVKMIEREGEIIYLT